MNGNVVYFSMNSRCDQGQTGWLGALAKRLPSPLLWAPSNIVVS